MVFRTFDERIILIHDTIEIKKVELEKTFQIIAFNLNEKSKNILLYETQDKDTWLCVWGQCVGLLRGRSVQYIDFKALESNPDKEKYRDEEINWGEKKKTNYRNYRKKS